MMRLVISALLAVLVHAYWLFSDIGVGDGASPGEAPKAVFISLVAAVQRPAPGPRGQPGIDAKPVEQQRQPVPVATQPLIEESKYVPTDRDVPVEDDGAMRFGKWSETKAKDQAMADDVPSVAKDDGSEAQRRPVVTSTPKTEAKKHETGRAPREDKARIFRQRSPNARARSQVAKAEQVERETAAATSAEPQAGGDEAGDSAPDDLGKARPDRGVAVNREHSLARALKGMLKEARPIYKRNPRPPYPRVARRRGYEGTVIVRALVGIDGLVSEVRLDESSGYETLDGAAMQTVQRWAFEPAVRGTETIEMWVRVPLRFSLD